MSLPIEKNQVCVGINSQLQNYETRRIENLQARNGYSEYGAPYAPLIHPKFNPQRSTGIESNLPPVDVETA